MFRVNNRLSMMFVARVLLAVYLFGIGIAGAQACLSSAVNMSAAFVHADDGMPACHHQTPPDHDACLKHCMQSDEVASSLPVDKVVQHSSAPMAVLPLLFVEVHPPRDQSIQVVAINSSPPISIAFCRFLN